MTGSIQLSLSSDADNYRRLIERKRLEVFAKIANLPIGVLIWESIDGDNPICSVRSLLYSELIKNGHLAACNTELIDPSLPFSTLIQKYTHLEVYDLVFSIPDSLESISEIRELARMPQFAHKVITFFNRDWHLDQPSQGLIELQASATGNIVPYDPTQLPMCIIDYALETILRVQEIQFMMGRRI